MKEWLIFLTDSAVLVIDTMALTIIVIGTLEAFGSGVRTLLVRSDTSVEQRAVWFRYARWLVAGLTFQLAADIIETSIAPTWDDIGRLGAIALIRTFLNYFLERDIREAREA